MLEWIDEISLMYVVYFAFTGIIYLLGRIFSNQGLLRYSETLVKEGVLFAVLIGVSYVFYYALYEFNVPAGFYDELFSSSTGFSGTIYQMAMDHLTHILEIAQKALYFYVELEGRILHYSSFQCSGCPSGFSLTCLGNIGSVKRIFTYKNYIEPLQATVATSRAVMEQAVRVLFTFWILVDLAHSKVFMALIPIAVIIRLLPGMKFVGNILFSLMLAFVVVLPMLAVVQAYIFYNEITDLETQLNTNLNVNRLPPYVDPGNLLGMFTLVFGGCNIAGNPPYIEKSGNELYLKMNTFPLPYQISDRVLKEFSQKVFLISVFNLSAGVVGMIAFVKGVSDLLGERNSFIDLFLRII